MTDISDFAVIDGPISEALAEMQDMIDNYEPGTIRDAMRAKFDRLVQRLNDAPAKLMALAPVASREEAHRLVHEELLFALRGWGGDA
jgi:hypothetical protein